MPTLNWIGKEKVINHHLDVPFRTLERKYSFDCENGQTEHDNNSENMIIHGDNLEALKALLPKYEGKVKCIYIDPPYNTGNSEWIYNDNVNDEKLKKWFGATVGKENEDLSRHDKWACMIYPRLKILEKLLLPDGCIFVSIDDGEVNILRMIMDEIFGRSRFIAQFVWKSRQNKDNRNTTNVSIDHEYILCYGKALLGAERKKSQYANPDNDPRGAWTSANMVGLADERNRPNLHYDLINPNTGINYGKPPKGWRYDRNTMKKLIDENRILWPSNRNGRPRKKQFFSELTNEYTGFSSIIGEGLYTNSGTKELREIFGETSFPFPKCSSFIEELLLQGSDEDSIILDSFAGSGTTGHAVLKLNQKDGGNRKFILIEMEDYADSITAERIKRAISGYSDIAGLGGDFGFYELGRPLFNSDTTLNESIDTEEIRKYIWFMETRSNYEKPSTQTINEFYLGSFSDTAYYFYYDRTQRTSLTYEFLATISKKSTSYVIYADTCMIDESDLVRLGIIFKKIPRDISKL